MADYAMRLLIPVFGVLTCGALLMLATIAS